MSDKVRVAVRPDCDFCGKPAYADGKTKKGPWANMCEEHFKIHGVGLGTGKGQRYIVKSEEEPKVDEKPVLRCSKGLQLRPMSSNGMHWIGTIVEEGEEMGIPNCRCSGYYKSKEDALTALDKRTFYRVCDENTFCHGGKGCLVK